MSARQASAADSPSRDHNDVPITADDRQLLHRAAAHAELRTLDELTEDALGELTRSHGVDFATAVFFDRVANSAEHSAFIERIDELRHRSRPSLSGTTFAVVPGAFYREYPNTGAGGRAILAEARRCGCEIELIPTGSVATPAENGRAICDWLAERGQQNIVLLSLSKGGADVRMALDDLNAAELFRQVSAWINVGGIVHGSPMARWVLSRKLPTLTYRILFWWFRHDYSFVTELDRHGDNPLSRDIQLPDHVRAIHVIGTPLTKHLSSSRAARWHRRLAAAGPNDSVTLLSDVLRLPGHILPIWGADHYLQDGWQVEQLIAALLAILSEETPV